MLTPVPPADRYLTTRQLADLPQIAVAAQTVVDWILVGLVVPDESDPRGVRKRRIRLPAHKVGGRWKVQESDSLAFIERITKASLPDGEPEPLHTTAAENKRRGEKAREECMKKLKPWLYGKK